MRNYNAANELNRISNLSAFNVQGATERRRYNQHYVRYTFADGSTLHIYPTRRRADAFHPAWTGSAHDVALGPVVGTSLKVTR